MGLQLPCRALAPLAVALAGLGVAALAVGPPGTDDAGRFRGMTRPGRALVDVLVATARSSALSSLEVFGTHSPAGVFLSLLMAGIRVAGLRSCFCFMVCKLPGSKAGWQLAEPGTSAQRAAPPSRRLFMARQAAPTLCDRGTCSKDAATNLRSVSASSRRVLTGPS